MKYYVYTLTISEIEYIGHSKHPEIRFKQHLRCIKDNTKGLFYDAARGLETPTMTILKEFKTKADSKRYEIYLILDRYFKGLKLWQKIPNISDR